MRAIVFGILSAIVLSFSAAAEYPKPPLEAYGALPQVQSAEISPDGTKVAVIANLPTGTRLIVFETDGSITHQFGVEESKARGIRFYDNEHVIMRASETTRTFGFRGEYEYSGAFSINLETLDVVQLLSRTKGMFPAQSGLGWIAGRGAKPGEVLMPAWMGRRGSDPNFDLLTARLGTARGSRYVRGTPDTRDWFIGDGGNVLARERYNNRSNLFSIQWRDGNGWETIFEQKTEIPQMWVMGVMPDESGLVFIGDGDRSYGAPMKLGAGGEISGPIIPPHEREIDTVYLDSNRKFLGVRYAGLTPEYYFLDEKLQASFDSVLARLPDATVYLDSWSDDRSAILYRAFSPQVGDVWLVHKTESDDLKLLARRRPGIPVEADGVMLSVEYKARDDLKIQAILTFPPDYNASESKAYPTIVLPHGGPASYDRFDYDWMAQYFANRGYLVVQPNFRGSTGFGQKFEDAGRGEWGGKMQDDITDAIAALAKANMVDPNQVCIVGASYGGYAALAGAVFTPELYKCVIAIAPVSDLNLMIATTKKERGSNHWAVSYWEDVMAEGDARRKKLKAISPVHFAENAAAPILLLHGDDDTVVPFNQSKIMERALIRAGKPVELIRLKGEDHGLSIASTRLQTLQAMDAFIAEHLPITE
ncbi:MAG: S9 family peptidase [Pseudomonadota bacterium]